jgi:hypothetical protein
MLDYIVLQFTYAYGPALLTLLFIIGVFILSVDFARFGKPLLEDTISHWHSTVRGLSIDPANFYKKVEALIRDWELPGAEFRRVGLREGGVISWRRTYLRVSRHGLIYDICLYPFGGGVFVSSWLREPTSFLHKIPLLGRVFRALSPKTYFLVDSAICFQEVAHAAVLAVLDEYTSTEGVRPIPNEERKPVMRELYMGNVPFVGPRAPALK